MELEFNKYIRKPFMVDGVEITHANIEAVAEIVGELHSKGDNPYIVLNRKLVPSVSRAYVGWFLTIFDGKYRCFAPDFFNEQFIEKEPVMSFVFGEVQDEFDETPPHGIPRPDIEEHIHSQLASIDIPAELVVD